MTEVLVFGIGKFYKNREEYIKNRYEIVAYLDNKIANQECIEYENTNKYIYPPSYALQNEKTKILIMSTFFYEIWQQLKEMGISDERIIFGNLFPPVPDAYQVLLEEEGEIVSKEDKLLYFSKNDEGTELTCNEDLGTFAYEKKRQKAREQYKLIDSIAEMPVEPASREFGLDRGKAIDRYYIEQILKKNKQYIKGKCLEIADSEYTLMYGCKGNITPYILHVEGWGENAIKGNLETGEGILEDFFDCAIITQTLMFTFDLQSVAQNIYKLLKHGGVAIVTVSGISPISVYDESNWGSYYTFHQGAMRKLFEPLFGKENVIVNSFGNVKTAMGLLYGLCQEDLQEQDFLVNDHQYPVIISAILKKE